MNWTVLRELAPLMPPLCWFATFLMLALYVSLHRRHRRAKSAIRRLRTERNRMAIVLGNHGLTIP